MLQISNDLRRLVAVALLSICLPWLQTCTTNPATGASEFTPFMSPEDEVKVGVEQHRQILAEFGGAYEDRRIQAYVNDLGQRLAAQSELPDLKWTFTVLDSDIVNAFALPGGFVYVSRGLLALADTEDQLAGVLGHEIGHVTARHAANRYSAAAGTSILVTSAAILSDIFLGGGTGQLIGQAGGIAAQGFLASYSRSQELQADELGIRYLARTDYDTESMADFLAKMEDEASLLAKLQNDAPRGFSYLDTHPPTEERVAEARQLAAATPGSQKPGTRQAFFQKIDGLIYGDSPEQGFRKGREFLHPGLRIAFQVPQGFFLLNSPQKLIARGPDGTAIVFDAAPQGFSGGPSQYLTQWTSGARLQGREDFTTHGLPGATGYAQARTNSGTALLRLAAIAWPDGRIYRFQFLAPASKANQYDPEFKQVLQSFRQLSTKEAAALRPDRIHPYRVRSGDTVSSLARRLPFDKLAEERLQVLNGLNSGTSLAPGTWIKMVSGG
jgi:predicted Zn-dependent protease